MTGVEKRIHEMCRSRRLAHGLLFSGPDLNALLTTAKEVAQNFACEMKAEAPCGRCLGCLKVMEGNHPDTIILEPEKQEITIEQMRELQLWIARAPYEASVKIAIVQRADTMNAAAANSLLKTLEEPPPHAYLILTTSSPDSLLKTILSRVQQIRFSAPEEIAPSESEDSEWLAAFRNLSERKVRATPEAIFSLTSEVSENKETLRAFFRVIEERLRDEMNQAQLSGSSLAKLALLDSLFQDAIRAERALLSRYGNAGLTLDSLLLRWLV